MPILTSDEILLLADKLPVVSPVAIQLVSLIDNPKTRREQIVELVASDETLFAQCFKQANSAAIGSVREYKTIAEIVDILGFAHIRKVALFAAAKSIIKDPSIWFESVFTAVAAQYLARKAGLSAVDSDKVYMAALFLNYGSFILLNFYPAIYSNIHPTKSFVLKMQKELAEFGISSPEISALVLSRYGVPDSVLEIISKQANVYQKDFGPENVFIEVARLMLNLQNADTEKIRAELDIEAVKDLVKNTRLPLAEIDQDTLDKIKVDTRDYAMS